MFNEKGKILTPMPEEFLGKFRNGGINETCDMIQGPCVCGAWHKFEDWPEEVKASAKFKVTKSGGEAGKR